MSFTDTIQAFAEEPLTHQVMLHVLGKYKRPNDKINELVKAGMLTTLKKGLYIPGPKLNIQKPEPFLMANHLRGPSYVSLESALSYWGFIPERVYQTTSVTLQATKTYNTQVGSFSYQHLAFPYYSFGIRRLNLSAKQVALVASPEKALCDKVILTSGIFLRSVKQTLAFLVEDMRIDEEYLQQLNLEEMTTWLEHAPKASSLNMLIKTISTL